MGGNGVGNQVSMRDVAMKAGVAVSTVSRAFANPDRINAETRALVMRAAEELGYAAPEPKPRRTPRSFVALLVPDIRNSFYFDIIRGSQERLFKTPYLQVLVNTKGSGDEERTVLESLTGVARGAILTTSRLGDDEVREYARRLPIVTFNRAVAGIPDLSIDTAKVVGHAVEHLAALGHTRICYVSGPTQSVVNRQRWNRCQDMAEALGVEVVSIGPFSPWDRAGDAAADMLLETRATAAIAFNDLVAIDMLRRLNQRGVAVPDDLSIVGCDDIEGSDFCSPPLTTISAPTLQVGRDLTSLMLDLIERSHPGPSPHVELPVHLEVRGSTGPAPRPPRG